MRGSLTDVTVRLCPSASVSFVRTSMRRLTSSSVVIPVSSIASGGVFAIVMTTVFVRLVSEASHVTVAAPQLSGSPRSVTV